MDPRSFYNKLWNAKSQPGYSSTIKRDWFHRLILDPIFDFTANPRHQVALRLLRGGHRLLDIGCWNGYLLERIREAGLYQELYGVDIVPEGIETMSFFWKSLRLRRMRGCFSHHLGNLMIVVLTSIVLLSTTTEPMRYPTGVWYLFALGSVVSMQYRRSNRRSK